MGKRARKQSQARVKAREFTEKQMSSSMYVDDEGFVVVNLPSAQEMHEAEVMPSAKPSLFGFGFKPLKMSSC
eukprot:CAMPEP_0182909064 /NCGR_PEP_ID=MMETSP0034_2-20130328/35552_1 /TAXON_ID=156128 /ORGANISM="Nephroselmis pyriformis, Strain CCMP717" /LENGTH=71 /DNA_ID=CAMNT_0025045293 /DNA_START=135 /DNA_END=350 /DNA_ORIENTATION=+